MPSPHDSGTGPPSSLDLVSADSISTNQPQPVMCCPKYLGQNPASCLSRDRMRCHQPTDGKATQSIPLENLGKEVHIDVTYGNLGEKIAL